MNLGRAYARWLRNRLLVLLPAVFLNLLVLLFLGLREGLRTSLKLAGLSLGFLINAALGYFLIQTLLCAALQKNGARRDAQSLRRLLASYRPAVGVCLALLCVLTLLPEVFRETPAAPPAAPAPIQRRRVYLEPVEVAALPHRLAQPPVAPAPPVPIAAPAEIVEATADLPRTLDDFEREGEPLAAEDAQDEGAPQDDPADEGPKMRINETLLRELREEPARPRIDRLGLPDERSPLARSPIETRLEFMMLDNDEAWEGSGFGLTLDFPLSRNEFLRASYMFAAFMETEDHPFEGRPDIAFGHTTMEYVFRLAGYTRHAPFDLAVGAGMSIDVFDFQHHDIPSDDPRLSPYVSVELGLWQSGPVGLVLHAGQSIPGNLTGGTAMVTDLQAVLRVDLTDNVSIHGGYRWMRVELRDYDGPFVLSHDQGRFGDEISGPLLGLDIHF